MTANDAYEVRYYYKQFKRLRKIASLLGNKKHEAEALFYASLLVEKLITLPEWNILKPDDFSYSSFVCQDVIPKLLVSLGLPFSCWGRKFNQFKQYCGFGENWKKKPQYSKRAKAAVASYLIVCALPTKMPPRNIWGKLLRKEFHKCMQKLGNEKRYRNRAIRLAILNVGRKLLKQLWRLQKDEENGGNRKLLPPDALSITSLHDSANSF